MSLILGSYMIEFLSKRGSQISSSQAIAYYLILPALVVMAYTVKRFCFKKGQFNKATAFDKRLNAQLEVREDSMNKQNTIDNPDSDTDASIPTERDQKRESWF
jgi:hypothetical protein